MFHRKRKRAVSSGPTPALERPIRRGRVGAIFVWLTIASAATAFAEPPTPETRLFDRLTRYVEEGQTPALEVSFGPRLEYRVTAVEDESLVLTLTSAPNVKIAPISWPWPQVAIDDRVTLLDRVADTPALRLDLARYCFRFGKDDEAHEFLHGLLEQHAELEPQVHAVLREALDEEGDARFEWFLDRFVLPAERERILVRNAEAWLLARQAADDEQFERADSIFEKARWLQRKGFFEMARAMFRKVAFLDPNTNIGRASAEIVEDNAFLLLEPIHESGPSKNRVDVVILGDGYQLDDRAQSSFRRATERLVEFLLEREVFAEYGSYFNFYRGHTSSKESGVDNHTQDYSTALGGKWSGASQGQVTVDHGLVRSMLARHEVPWDNAMVMVKRGGLGTGGGRISAFAHASTETAYHEFGHSFAGLLDEYNTQVSDTPNLGGAPRGWNIANSPDPELSPWKHWLDAKTPGVGMYRGGAGGAEGAYRPTDSGCLMNSGNELCVVCREQMVRTIYRYVRPIEKVTPEPGTRIILPGEKLRYELVVLKPASRVLEVTWTFNGQPAPGDRERKVEKDGVHESLLVDFDELKIARGYRGVLSATVRDTTDWVLKDDDNLLEQKVSWVLERPEEKESERTTELPGKGG